MQWSAAQYSRFERERNQPVLDLLARLPQVGVERAADLGCGPGNSTELLLQRYPQAEVVGLDQSTDMLEAARTRLPQLRFEQVDLGDWRSPVRYDLLLANASLQWLPRHAQLLPALFEHLNPGGSLAVQMPDNLEEPAHRLMREVAGRAEWAGQLAGVGRQAGSLHDAVWYYRCLSAAGARVEVWRTVYLHPLAGGPQGVIDWFSGSALRPYLQRLDGEAREDFLGAYRERLQGVYPQLDDGTVLLPFPRLFFIATRQGGQDDG